MCQRVLISIWTWTVQLMDCAIRVNMCPKRVSCSPATLVAAANSSLRPPCSPCDANFLYGWSDLVVYPRIHPDILWHWGSHEQCTWRKCQISRIVGYNLLLLAFQKSLSRYDVEHKCSNLSNQRDLHKLSWQPTQFLSDSNLYFDMGPPAIITAVLHILACASTPKIYYKDCIMLSRLIVHYFSDC
jgi:hypothetical protein